MASKEYAIVMLPLPKTNSLSISFKNKKQREEFLSLLNESKTDATFFLTEGDENEERKKSD